jgi:hypothetical protein
MLEQNEIMRIETKSVKSKQKERESSLHTVEGPTDGQDSVSKRMIVTSVSIKNQKQTSLGDFSFRNAKLNKISAHSPEKERKTEKTNMSVDIIRKKNREDFEER